MSAFYSSEDMLSELANVTSERDFEFFLNRLDYFDITKLDGLDFTQIIEWDERTARNSLKNDTNLPQLKITDEMKLKILKKLIDNDFDLNESQNGTWAYGHYIFRHADPIIVDYVYKNNLFDYDLITSTNWHAFQLLLANISMNSRQTKENKLELLKLLIKLAKTHTIKKTIAVREFLVALNRHFDRLHAVDDMPALLDELLSTDNVLELIYDNIEFIIESELQNIIPKEIINTFLF